HVDHDRHRQLACSGRLVMKRGDQFFYRFPIIEAFQDRQTKGLTQLVMTWQMRYGKRHEGPPSDNSSDFFFQYVRLKTPLFAYLSSIVRSGRDKSGPYMTGNELPYSIAISA